MPVDPIRKRALDRARKYGLTLEAAFAVDSVRYCQATGRLLTRGSHLDHSHDTGQARGVLDPLVNRALAHGLTPTDLRAMANYLERTADPSFDWYADRLRWLEAHRRHAD